MNNNQTVFTSRLFSVHSDFEEVSLRDTVTWRVENSDFSLGHVCLTFKIDLYCSKKPITAFHHDDTTFDFRSYLNSSTDPSSSVAVVDDDEVGMLSFSFIYS